MSKKIKDAISPAVERYKKNTDQRYRESRTKLFHWIATNDKIMDEAKQNFENIDNALNLCEHIKTDLT